MSTIDRDAPTGSPSAAPTARLETSPGVLVFDPAPSPRARCVRVGSTLRIGRASTADLVLDDAAASRLHAELKRSGDGLTIRDLGSSHGVRVGGANIGNGERHLVSGDVVRIGDSVLVVVDATADHGRFEQVVLPETEHERSLLGGSSARALWGFCERFGPVAATVFLLGETGTGKDVAACALHDRSARKGPLVTVNCAALPAELVESQLFGHKKGSFSGATETSVGYFVAANGGTLFLDEVGELPSATQGKLLRALENFEIVPVGASKAVRVDVRVVAATSRDVMGLLERGTFRRDLYHRLNGVSLWLPPLRDRTEELPFLAAYFLARANGTHFTPSALERLMVYKWPGNVRELKQVVFAAAVRASARAAPAVDVDDLELPEEITASPKMAPKPAEVIAALRKHQGNVTHAARSLGVHRAQLYRVLDENGLSCDDFRT